MYQKRYPTREAGVDFMKFTDEARRSQLLAFAEEISSDVVSLWHSVKPQEPIAVVLFGSVATGLVKNIYHPQPSNIDMAVIGTICDDERLWLLDAIRPKRNEIQKKIVADCSFIDPEEKNPGNVGLYVQDRKKVENQGYKTALEYISAGAFALSDDFDMWKKIEQEAIDAYVQKLQKKRRYSYLWNVKNEASLESKKEV